MYPINLNNAPDGFELIDDNVPFDPKKHLQLEKPSETYSVSYTHLTLPTNREV